MHTTTRPPKNQRAVDINTSPVTQLAGSYTAGKSLTLAKVFHLSFSNWRMTPPSNISKCSSVSPLTMIISAECQSAIKQHNNSSLLHGTKHLSESTLLTTCRPSYLLFLTWAYAMSKTVLYFNTKCWSTHTDKNCASIFLSQPYQPSRSTSIFLSQPYQPSRSTSIFLSQPYQPSRSTSTEAEFYSFFYFYYFTGPCRMFRSPYLGKVQQPQQQHYPLLPVNARFSCVQTMVWLPVLM